MKKFRAVCLAFVMMLSVAVMLCGCGDTKITDKVNFSDVDEITVVMSDESTAVLGEVDFKTVKNILQSAETGGTSGEFDGGILIETRKDGIVTHNIRVGGADKICVDKDNSTVYKISDDDYKTLENLNTLFVAFFDLLVHANSIAGSYVDDGFFLVTVINCLHYT